MIEGVLVIVAIDSNVFIYWLDSRSAFHEQAVLLLESLTKDETTLTCSTLVASEILSKKGIPLNITKKLPVQWQDVNLAIAETAGKLRQDNQLGLQDAIHIASALTCRARTFYTNDKQLLRLKRIKELAIQPLV